MFGIAGTAELSTFCPGTGTWNRLQDGTIGANGRGLQQSRSPSLKLANTRLDIAMRWQLMKRTHGLESWAPLLAVGASHLARGLPPPTAHQTAV